MSFFVMYLIKKWKFETISKMHTGNSAELSAIVHSFFFLSPKQIIIDVSGLLLTMLWLLILLVCIIVHLFRWKLIDYTRSCTCMI